MPKLLSPIPQSISPKEKEALGFLDGGMETITSNGSYTLNTAGARSGTVCFKMSIQNGGRTLYAEYRNFTEKGDKYDNQQKELYRYDGALLKGVNLKSGLVLYISNSDNKFPSNTNGSAGRWDYEIPCGSYATKSDAALGLNEGYEIANGIFISVDEIKPNGPLTGKATGRAAPPTGVTKGLNSAFIRAARLPAQLRPFVRCAGKATARKTVIITKTHTLRVPSSRRLFRPDIPETLYAATAAKPSKREKSYR